MVPGGERTGVTVLLSWRSRGNILALPCELGEPGCVPSLARLSLKGPSWGGFEGFLVAQTVKHLPTMQETRVQCLGLEDLLEKDNANPLQYSCLENPMDGGTW